MPYKRRTFGVEVVVMALEDQTARSAHKASRVRKGRRIEARTDAETEERIIRAAALTSTSVSTFVVSAAAQRADEILAQAQQVTVMPAEQFDALMASLDVADEAPVLVAAAVRARRFARR
jgi:uncharacterized protein (DUF1778 family)